MASRAHAKAVLRHHLKRLLALPNVVAAAIGRKITKGRVAKDDWCIRVHVTRKTLRPSKRSVPRFLSAPPTTSRNMGPVETDVVQTGMPQLHAGDGNSVTVGSRQKIRVLKTGTVGCLLESSVGRRFALTAGHVLSPALVVDGLRNGSLDSGVLPDAELPDLSIQIGTCARCSRPTNYVDLGLIRLWDEFEVRPEPWISGFRVVDNASRRLVPGEQIRVLRLGRMIRTKFHAGADSDGVVCFQYPLADGSMYSLLVNDIVFYHRSGGGAELESGDSGSAVIDSEGKLIGIHIGASDGGPGDGDGMPLGYAVGGSSIRDWARNYSLRTTSGLTSLT